MGQKDGQPNNWLRGRLTMEGNETTWGDKLAGIVFWITLLVVLAGSGLTVSGWVKNNKDLETISNSINLQRESIDILTKIFELQEKRISDLETEVALITSSPRD